jgi:hypothetical protein
MSDLEAICSSKSNSMLLCHLFSDFISEGNSPFHIYHPLFLKLYDLVSWFSKNIVFARTSAVTMAMIFGLAI